MPCLGAGGAPRPVLHGRLQAFLDERSRRARPTGARIATGVELAPPPQVTALGALLNHLRTPAKKFQPSNVNFGLTPPLEERMKKANRKMAYPERARKAWGEWTAG